jgi:outer membrane protein with beta-barrel domain
MKYQGISSKTIVLHVGRTAICLATALLISAGGMSAQEEEGRKWTVNAGVGFSPLVGALDKRLDNGWHVSFGGGYNFNSRFSVGGQVMYDGFGVSRGVLQEVGVPDGNAHLWAITAEPRYSFAPGRKVDVHVVGGMGYYKRVAEFTKPTVAAVVIFDPFFGFVPILVPANVVIGRITRDGIGGNAGLGFTMRLGRSGVKLFTEARFHYSNGGGIPTRIVPLTIGVRY